ncbi:phosphoesterase family-domain-containing protein [Globomyces pollinis-pini]|nr:phosphoesterase family-domain-containing protein [Globomyces pollinis-pini]
MWTTLIVAMMTLTTDTIAKAIQVSDTTPINANIKTLVILMLENRSFDHVFGRLKIDGLMDVNGLTGTEFNYLSNGSKVWVRPAKTKKSFYDPGHGLQQVSLQILDEQARYIDVNGTYFYPKCWSNGSATMGGFAKDVEIVSTWDYNQKVATFDESIDTVFSYQGPDTMPILYKLATNYAVIDDWYASFPGNTIPNRKFFYAANPQGSIANGGGTDSKSIFVNMENHNRTWSHYYDGNGEWSYTRYLNDVGCVPGFTGCPNVKRPYGLKRLDEFFSDATKGTLPELTSIDSSGSWDMHPGKGYAGGTQEGGIEAGELMIKRIYQALRSSPQWNTTALLITFDEHGGYYDHQPPPNYKVPKPDDSPISNNGPIGGDWSMERLGVRVPALVISPWVPKGQVFRSAMPTRNFEHSSLSATLKKLFGLSTFLSRRDAWAMSFHDIFNYVDTPRTDIVDFDAVVGAVSMTPSPTGIVTDMGTFSAGQTLSKTLPPSTTITSTTGSVLTGNMTLTSGTATTSLSDINTSVSTPFTAITKETPITVVDPTNTHSLTTNTPTSRQYSSPTDNMKEVKDTTVPSVMDFELTSGAFQSRLWVFLISIGSSLLV